jgi:PEP-CTERM motif
LTHDGCKTTLIAIRIFHGTPADRAGKEKFEMLSRTTFWSGLSVALLAAAQFGAVAAPLNLTNGDKITLDWGPGTYGHGSGGGEFMARGVAGSVLNGAGDSFITFCMEYSEHISLNTPYYVAISTTAKSGGNGVAATYAGDVAGVAGADPISFATAWLYTQFRTNQLHNFVSFNYTSNADANSLQAALWFLENEQPLSFLDATAVALKDAAIGAGWTSLGNVRVMNLYDTRTGTPGNYTFSGHHQDQLYLSPVPEPETYAMLLAGLGLMSFGLRRKRRPVS